MTNASLLLKTHPIILPNKLIYFSICLIAIALNAKNSLKNREQLTTTIKQSAEDEPTDKQQTKSKTDSNERTDRLI